MGVAQHIELAACKTEGMVEIDRNEASGREHRFDRAEQAIKVVGVGQGVPSLNEACRPTRVLVRLRRVSGHRHGPPRLEWSARGSGKRSATGTPLRQSSLPALDPSPRPRRPAGDPLAAPRIMLMTRGSAINVGDSADEWPPCAIRRPGGLEPASCTSSQLEQIQARTGASGASSPATGSSNVSGSGCGPRSTIRSPRSLPHDRHRGTSWELLMRGRSPPYNRSMTAFPDEGDASAGASHEDGWAGTLRAEYAGRSVLVTGHTGFKGSWLALWLHELGANVTGFALDPPTRPSNFVKSARRVRSARGPSRGHPGRRSSRAGDPIEPTGRHPPPGGAECSPRGVRGTGGDVLRECPGTAVLLDALRAAAQPCAVVVVTSDKCYLNDESGRPFEEDDPLGGHDPYSASKAGTELVVNAYRDSFFPTSHVDDHGVAIATARAGNVIGGGDWTANGVLPDIVRSIEAGQPVRLRSPNAIRPWQHVLEPLGGYLTLAAHLRGPDRASFCRAWNFGPDATEEATVRQLTERLLAAWGVGSWEDGSQPDDPPEAGVLRLSTRRAQDAPGLASSLAAGGGGGSHRWLVSAIRESVVRRQDGLHVRYRLVYGRGLSVERRSHVGPGGSRRGDRLPARIDRRPCIRPPEPEA